MLEIKGEQNMSFLTNLKKKMFKRKAPYAPLAYLGRKKVKKILDAKVEKNKNLAKKEEN
jgi:hypothetical protein